MRPVIVKVMDAARALGRQAHSAAKPDRSYAVYTKTCLRLWLF